MEEKILAIVIPVFNNWHFTKNTIQYLNCLNKTHHIIIVDNASTDNTSKLISSENITVIKNSQNLFFAKACNQGYFEAKKLGYKNVMFLNNDIKVVDKYSDWTKDLIHYSELGMIVGPTVGCLDSNYNFICEAGKIPTNGHWYLSGWNITASIENWDKLVLPGEIGPFSSEFGFYFEDTDLGLRAHKQNIMCSVVPVPVKHFGKASSKQLGVNTLFSNAKTIFLNKWGKTT